MTNARCELGQLLEVPRGSLRKDTKLHRAWMRLGWRGPRDPLEARAASHVTHGHVTLLVPQLPISGAGSATRWRRDAASQETLGYAGNAGWAGDLKSPPSRCPRLDGCGSQHDPVSWC